MQKIYEIMESVLPEMRKVLYLQAQTFEIWLDSLVGLCRVF